MSSIAVPPPAAHYPPAVRDPVPLLHRTLREWGGRDDLWVFAYASLIWRPDFDVAEQRLARVHGWHRALQMWSRVNRGTPERPGLVFALLSGGSCHGAVLRVPQRDGEAVLHRLWDREMMTGVYDIPNARFEGLAVFTNKVCTEPYRGAGRPEAAYFIERAMDVLAEKLGLDPAEMRRRNFIAPNRFPYRTAIGAEYDSGDYGRALEKALALIDYPALRAEQRRQRQTTGGRLLGIGLACYVEVCGFGPWEMGRVTVDGQGQVTILSGTMPNGQGHHTTWAQIAAEALQIPLTDITVKTGDTAVVPRGNGTYGSRSTPVGGSAVRDNAESVRARALQIAAHLLEAAPEDMELVTGRFQVRGVPDRSLTWRDVAQAAHNDNLPEDMRGELSADQNFKPGGETYPFGVHVCLVEVETETGHIDIKRYLTVDDCGVVINPLLAEGQIHGGIAQGIGQALFEGAVYDELGNLLSGSLMDYAVPKAYNLPSYDANRTETPSPHNPLGVKGIGEAATIGSTPAVVNAVIDALASYGIRHLDMPLTAEKIWTAVRNSANSS